MAERSAAQKTRSKTDVLAVIRDKQTRLFTDQKCPGLDSPAVCQWPPWQRSSHIPTFVRCVGLARSEGSNRQPQFNQETMELKTVGPHPLEVVSISMLLDHPRASHSARMNSPDPVKQSHHAGLLALKRIAPDGRDDTVPCVNATYFLQ